MGVLKFPLSLGNTLEESTDTMLEHDKKQFLVGIAVWGVITAVMFYKDYQFLGNTPSFFWLLILRLSFTLVTAVIGWLVMTFIRQRLVFNGLVAIWSILAVLVSLVVNGSRPTQDASHYIVDLVALFSFYFFIPHNLLIRVIPPLLFTTYDIAEMLIHPGAVSRQTMSAVMFSFTLTNCIGILVSFYTFSKNRKEVQFQAEEKRVRAELLRLATTDSMTGAYNRRRLIEIAGEAFYRYHRYRRPFSLLMMDLDGFKQINDTFGHQQGDVTLIEFTRMVISEKREADALGRMGGDEFCLVLPETSRMEAVKLAERILRRCAGLTINHNTALSLTVSVSIGITEVKPQDQSIDNLISRGDTALYSAKNAGKNRWMFT
jgi:diguanylate cyclase (GGDEF)-like protein